MAGNAKGSLGRRIAAGTGSALGWVGKVLSSMPFQVAFWVALAAGATYLALHRAGVVTEQGLQPPGGGAVTAANVDAIHSLVQTVLLLLGFLGVTATAVITYRRQRNSERQLDLEERRQRDESRHLRYAKGAEMLGHKDPAIRIAGLNVVAQLGNERGPGGNKWRQTCVNLLCAYLRSNSSNPGKVGRGDDDSPATAIPDNTDRSYWVAAEEACRLIAGLLDLVYSPPWWKPDHRTPINLDLHGAHLPAIALRERLIGLCSFDGATFTESAGFDGAKFGGLARFDGATFTDSAWFEGATFTESAVFDGATFGGTAVFEGATFSKPARFERATFGGIAVFAGATFSKSVWFERATFGGTARFDEATFCDLAHFEAVSFVDTALFRRASFAGVTRFLNARWISIAFEGAKFSAPPAGVGTEWLDGASVGGESGSGDGEGSPVQAGGARQ